MKKRILIALGVLVLAAGIGAGGWYYYTHHAGSSGGSDIVYVTKISKLSEMDSGVENRSVPADLSAYAPQSLR